MTDVECANLCPKCESTLRTPTAKNRKYNREHRVCLGCRNQWTTAEVYEFYKKGIDYIDDHEIHRLHRRLANVLLDGRTVAICKSSRADMEIALKELLDIGLERVFEHLLDTSDYARIESEETAEVIKLSDRKGT